jgi:hypothetical protein
MWWRRQQPRLTFGIGPVTTLARPMPRSHSPTGYPRSPQPRPKEASVYVTITDIQSILITPNVTDERGNPVPATALGSPTYLVDNATVLQLTPAADGSNCVGNPVGPLGHANVSFTGILPSGAAVSALPLAIQINPSAATSVVLTATIIEPPASPPVTPPAPATPAAA